MTMIERVAAAIHEADIAAMASYKSKTLVYRDLARAAIAAMREPTEAMLDYGTRPTWQAMLDAALGGKQ